MQEFLVGGGEMGCGWCVLGAASFSCKVPCIATDVHNCSSAIFPLSSYFMLVN